MIIVDSNPIKHSRILTYQDPIQLVKNLANKKKTPPKASNFKQMPNLVVNFDEEM